MLESTTRGSKQPKVGPYLDTFGPKVGFPQTAQRRSSLYTLGPKVRFSYVLPALDGQISIAKLSRNYSRVSKVGIRKPARYPAVALNAVVGVSGDSP